MEYQRIVCDQPGEGVTRVTLAPAEKANAQGQHKLLQSAKGWQQVGHANARLTFGQPVDPRGSQIFRADRTKE